MWSRDPNVRVSKTILTRIEERSESQSKDQGVKDPNTTHMATWAIRHTTMLVKVFVVTRLNFGQGVGKGATYSQSALIPTCYALNLIVH